MKEKVLFICVHNSARSQMAEEYLRKFAAERFEVESAGLEPGTISSQVTGSIKKKLERVREIRDQIKHKILEFVRENSAG